MDPALEIRKCPISEIVALSRILELDESWKILMGSIPKNLKLGDYRCDVNITNPPKYRSEHFRLIENASKETGQSCTEILFTEWGTSGRIRPALGHLLHLLVKAQLFRAADYVSMVLLKQPPPKRPLNGSPAVVKFTPSELALVKDPEMDRIEKILDEINYPSSAIEDINKLNSNTINFNLCSTEKAAVIPKIVISESPDTDESILKYTLPLVLQTSRSISSQSESNMNSSSLTNSPESHGQSESDQASPILPILSALNLSSTSVKSSSSEDSQLEPNIPNLSFTNVSDSANLPELDALMDLPQSSSSQTSRPCISPLPNLSLNTPLPHFSYRQLEFATNDFDDTPLLESGRFLGSGAFGKVYLAVGLFDKPVAVKKLLLDNVELVDVNDTVTQQFRNEVEVLTKYKHDNLVDLLGYSCDGCTYCLLYEYIPGGSLKDRLEKQESKLIWTERLYIALGTARAISYLHTAFSTPLIHRDVKSANILLDFANKPKLCDFGLIKLSPNQNTNRTRTILGTSAYMAPETSRGHYSVKSDTFSFGVVLLELLTSLPPILEENEEAVDLVTHVEETWDWNIAPLIDTTAGTWTTNEVNFATELYQIACQCLEEKKKRPNMVEIATQLGSLVQKAA